MKSSNTPKYIEKTEVVSPAGSKVLVKRIRLTRAGRDALTTLSEGVSTSSSFVERVFRRTGKKEPETV